MKSNKVIKIILSLVVMMSIFLGVGQRAIYASGTAQDSLTAMISPFRHVYDSETDAVVQSQHGYALDDNHKIFQIVELDNTTDDKIGINLYCLNATKGVTWQGGENVGSKVTYNSSYTLNNYNSGDYTYLKNALNLTDGYYSAVVWLLDNLYIPNQTDKNEFFANAGIVKDGGCILGINGVQYDSYYYNGTADYVTIAGNGQFGYNYVDSNGNIIDVLLPDELIEAVQQSAIWYFTNYLNNNTNDTGNIFDAYSTDNNKMNKLKYITGVDEKLIYANLSDYDIEGKTSPLATTVGQMYQEQAAILYNYLVDQAKEAKEEGYKGEQGTATIAITKNGDILKDTSGNYKIGPMKIETTGTVSNISLEVKDSNGIISCDIPTIVPGEEFYITNIPSTTEGKIEITAKAIGNITTQTVWMEGTGAGEEQPIVKVERTTSDITSNTAIMTISDEKGFDLALRKLITSVKKSDGTVLPILNENGLDATRTITANPLTIPNTATYLHRKDPVVVEKGDIVTYQIRIYNEGDIDGYASVIVDQLPTGLETTMGINNVVTAKKRNGNAGNEYQLSSIDDNKLVLTKNGTSKYISAYDSTTSTLDYETIELECKVTQNADKNKHYLTNIAYINSAYSTEGEVTQDRNNTESKPSLYPTEEAGDLNNTEVTYEGHKDNDSIYKDTNNEMYYKGQEDDDDFETLVVLPKEFDLKLVKYISAINGTASNRNITVDSSNLNKTVNGKRITTADYDVSKLPITVKTGDFVTYTFRIYNEAEIDGYASEISENIPEGLEYVYSTLTDEQLEADTTISAQEKAAIKFNRERLWVYDDKDASMKTIKTDYLSKTASEDNLIKAFDSSKDNGKGEGLSYKEVSVMFKVTSEDVSKIIRNEAAITEDTDEEGNEINDRDSDTKNWGKVDSDDYYDNRDYPKYKEDDEDYDNIRLLRFDLALRKFIGAISEDATISDGEYLTTDKTSKTSYTRAPKVDTSKLKIGEDTTAIYNHSKDPITVNAGDYVLYTIRVYNEGDLDGYAAEIKDYLPEYLNYIDGEFNKAYGWTYNSTDRTVVTTHLSSENGTANKINAFDKESDNGNGSGLSYKDVPILCRVSSNAIPEQNITNIAEITEYQDEEGKEKAEDIDSKSDNLNYPDNVPGYEGDRNGDNSSDTYYPGQEDDDDFDRVIVQEPKFDLALRKFITKINEEDVTTRIPAVSMQDDKITYTHPKDVVKVVVGDTVTYTLRVYNEGKIAGFAQTVTDDIPEYLEYLPKNATNVAYRWKMYDKDGNETDDVTKAEKIVTDYTSKENGEKLMQDGKLNENPNLLNAFDSSKEISDTNPDYTEVKVAFKVKDPNSSSYIIKNQAQISEDADENGNPVVDIDSIPNEWNDGEDDQDYENVSVEYFDLSLLKYVSEVEVTEKGTTTTTKTGNKGDKNDIIPKVEIHRKNLKSTVVKFIYTIKITNEGDIAGYATEITDYVPKGLKFYAEDNKGWEEKEDGVITTELLSDTLLEPGQSATVKVTFRWKNSDSNMGVKTNVAEISEDKNDKGIADRDSTPGNKKDGEDDIDDAQVLLSIKTGLTENIITYVSGAAIILLVLAGGVILIKKFVL